MAASDPIHCGVAIVHRRYGRGIVRFFDPTFGTASVVFEGDGDIPRRVMTRDCVPTPRDMPDAVLDDRASLMRAGVA